MDGQSSVRTWLQGIPLADALFHESGDALLLVDPLTERVVDANPMTLRLTELGLDELLQAPIRSLIRHEQQWQDWLVPAQETTTFHGADGFLLRTRQADRWVPVSITISRLHVEGSEPVALFALHDRREAVEAHRRLQRIEAELRRVLVSVSDCLWSCRIESDGRWRYRYLSPVVQRLTGQSVGLFLEDPQAWQQAIDGEDLPRWRAFVQRLTAGYSGELEYRLRRPDGACLWVRENVVAAPDEGGLLLHGVVTDISERKRAEQQREQQLRAQVQKLESLGAMAGVLAHEFNNLLTGILGHVSLARLTASAGEPTHSGLAQVEAITLRAAELCRQLTVVAGKGMPGSNARNVNALVGSVAEQVQRTLPERVRLRLALSETLPPVAGDEIQLRQVIGNLLTNAVEVVDAGNGEVVLRTLAPPATPVGFLPETETLCFDWNSAELKTKGACLEVCDCGPGIAPEIQPRLFDPFFSTKPGNRGLGLSTVLGIVRAHNGGIQVLTAPARGTTVRVFLPICEAAASVSAESTLPSATGASTPRSTGGLPVSSCSTVVPSVSSSAQAILWRGHGIVLIVDDESSVLDVASRLLRSMGYQVLEARDGAEALRLFGEHADEIRLALVDLTMPRMSGDATLRELRQRSADLPLVLMSGYSASEATAQMTGVKLAGYLQKPFRLPALMKLLQQVLPT